MNYKKLLMIILHIFVANITQSFDPAAKIQINSNTRALTDPTYTIKPQDNGFSETNLFESATNYDKQIAQKISKLHDSVVDFILEYLKKDIYTQKRLKAIAKQLPATTHNSRQTLPMNSLAYLEKLQKNHYQLNAFIESTKFKIENNHPVLWQDLAIFFTFIPPHPTERLLQEAELWTQNHTQDTGFTINDIYRSNQ